jgi:hypothetical protein
MDPRLRKYIPEKFKLAAKGSTSDFATFVNSGPIAGDYMCKLAFHAGAECILKEIAFRLKFMRADYTLKMNLAGDGVAGETSLHTDTFYILMGEFSDGSEKEFLYRSCKGRKDYVGGWNCWMKYSELSDLDEACRKIASVAASRNPGGVP